MTMGRLRQTPLLHFLAIGAALFVLSHWTFSSRETIRIQSADAQQLRSDWLRNTGQAPSAVQLQASLRQLIGDEALVREALKLGLDQSDPVVNQRLLRNIRFAFPERRSGEAALAREARSLGMVQQDLVIRRRLVQLMEARMVGELRFSEAELRDYMARHPERYAQAARYSFSHVFAAKLPRAQQLLEQLRSGAADPAQSGEPFPLGRERHSESRDGIGRALGPGLAATVSTAPAGEWIGPVTSIYGWHLIRVDEVEEAAPADFTRFRQQAALALQAERRDEHVRAGRERLIARYRVELPPGLAEHAEP
jgi:parvulin-like peptidyl-prolyl isomerase